MRELKHTRPQFPMAEGVFLICNIFLMGTLQDYILTALRNPVIHTLLTQAKPYSRLIRGGEREVSDILLNSLGNRCCELVLVCLCGEFFSFRGI